MAQAAASLWLLARDPASRSHLARLALEPYHREPRALVGQAGRAHRSRHPAGGEAGGDGGGLTRRPSGPGHSSDRLGSGFARKLFGALADAQVAQTNQGQTKAATAVDGEVDGKESDSSAAVGGRLQVNGKGASLLPRLLAVAGYHPAPGPHRFSRRGRVTDDGGGQRAWALGACGLLCHEPSVRTNPEAVRDLLPALLHLLRKAANAPRRTQPASEPAGGGGGNRGSGPGGTRQGVAFEGSAFAGSGNHGSEVEESAYDDKGEEGGSDGTYESESSTDSDESDGPEPRNLFRRQGHAAAAAAGGGGGGFPDLFAGSGGEGDESAGRRRGQISALATSALLSLAQHPPTLVALRSLTPRSSRHPEGGWSEAAEALKESTVTGGMGGAARAAVPPATPFGFTRLSRHDTPASEAGGSEWEGGSLAWSLAPPGASGGGDWLGPPIEALLLRLCSPALHRRAVAAAVEDGEVPGSTRAAKLFAARLQAGHGMTSAVGNSAVGNSAVGNSAVGNSAVGNSAVGGQNGGASQQPSQQAGKLHAFASCHRAVRNAAHLLFLLCAGDLDQSAATPAPPPELDARRHNPAHTAPQAVAAGATAGTAGSQAASRVPSMDEGLTPPPPLSTPPNKSPNKSPNKLGRAEEESEAADEKTVNPALPPVAATTPLERLCAFEGGGDGFALERLFLALLQDADDLGKDPTAPVEETKKGRAEGRAACAAWFGFESAAEAGPEREALRLLVTKAFFPYYKGEKTSGQEMIPINFLGDKPWPGA